MSPSNMPINFITLDLLYQAYRKAKVDVCNDKNQPCAYEFLEYEKCLHINLLRLQSILTTVGTNWFDDPAFIGSCGCVPKSLELVPPIDQPEKASSEPHFFISDSDDAWESHFQTEDGKIRVEFRPVAIFTVNMYIVSALWVNLVGHYFDGCLTEHAAGARVRRLKKKIPNSKVGEYHVQSLGTFPPYYTAYKKWRDNGMRSIRRELAEGKGVVAVTMDLTSFYHNIDAKFLLDETFLSEGIRFKQVYGRDLSDEERLFTELIIRAFRTWGMQKPGFSDDNPIGIPVGPSAPRIIANVLLAEFDRLMTEELEPIYYARYVDDIFLVLRDSGRYKKGSDVFGRLAKLLDKNIRVSDSEITLQFPYAAGSKLKFQSKKQRIFLLRGEAGQDLLDTIRNRIDEVSSEWRLLPDLKELEKSPAAKVLSSSRVPSEDANTLRKADDLSLNRLSFSILLRFYNQLNRDLPSREWKKERESFFRFSERHVLSPPKIFDLSNYIPALISLAVACRDWRIAMRLVKKIRCSFAAIESKCLPPESEQWECFYRLLAQSITQAIETAFPINSVTPNDEKQAQSLVAAVNSIYKLPEQEFSIQERSREYFWRDLGRIPFREAILGLCKLPSCPFTTTDIVFSAKEDLRSVAITDFLASTDISVAPEAIYPLMFPTRPFTVTEITEIDQRCVTDLERLHDLAWVIRGAWLKPLELDDDDAEEDVLTIGSSTKLTKPRIALTSHLVSDESWSCAAADRPNLSAARYNALVKLANSILTSSTRPDYVLFPELSIPRRWLPSLARRLRSANISLIAGVEYTRNEGRVFQKNLVVNEAYMYLMDDRSGYREQCVVKQRKGFPAHHEREELRQKFGIELASYDSKACKKRIIKHFGHSFGLLICSELTDIRFREAFRGKIDSLFVLSWNQDLESFAALVDSAALDIHCFVSLVNNRRFGDSRVRAPYKKQWRRDLVRVKGGLEDYFVTTELNLTELRQFQSYVEPPLGESAAFKPFPEGFSIAPNRKQVPWSQA
jgi:hypothetical protein